MFRICLIILCLSLLSCSKEVVEIPASLKEIIDSKKDCICEPYIDQYLWRNKTVFVVAARGFNCDTKTLYYYENGVQFDMEAGYTFDKFLAEISLVKNVWTCKQ